MKIIVSSCAPLPPVAERLAETLRATGHVVEQAAVPLSTRSAEETLRSVLLWRSLTFTHTADLATETGADLVIAVGFPAYHADHPRTVAWLPELHAPAHGGEDDRLTLPYRNAIAIRDREALARAARRFAMTDEAAADLRRVYGLKAKVLAAPDEAVGHVSAAWVSVIDTLTGGGA